MLREMRAAGQASAPTVNVCSEMPQVHDVIHGAGWRTLLQRIVQASCVPPKGNGSISMILFDIIKLWRRLRQVQRRAGR
ncbi:MAG: hypothetical protein ACK4P4_09155 [Allorhizobium sp.]